MRVMVTLACALLTLATTAVDARCQRGTSAPPPNAAVLTVRSEWHVEHDSASAARIVAGDGSVDLRFELAGGRPTNQFAAAVVPVPPDLEHFSRLVVRGRADRPMRIAIQLRQRDNLGAARWRRTMYLDAEPRTGTFDLREFRPVEPERTSAPPLSTIAALMLGVDTVNTRPGTRATIVLTDVRLER